MNKTITKIVQWVLLLLTLSHHNILLTDNNKKNLEGTFTDIYVNATWGTNEAGVGHSGLGSTLKNTKAYINFLQDFIKNNNIKSVVDFGCGDWEFSQHIDWSGTFYTGYDIVKSVIDNNIKKYSSASRKFIHANGLDKELVKADLLICKDVLQHLSNENIFKFLKQTHKFKYCLITNDLSYDKPSSNINKDIENGECRPLDLSKSPFKINGVFIFPFVPTDGHSKKPIFLISNQNNKNQPLINRSHLVVSCRDFDIEKLLSLGQNIG